MKIPADPSMLARTMSVAALLACAVCHGQTVSVGTNSNFVLTYPEAQASSGRIPWSDLGIEASADVSQGVPVLGFGSASGSVGGQTQFSLSSALAGHQAFTPGVTQIGFGYTPGWTGAINTVGSGGYSVDLGYSFGPLSGSVPILGGGVDSPTHLDLAHSLNTNGSDAVSSSAAGNGASQSLTVAAQKCLIVCVTLASATLDFTVGTHLDETLGGSANVIYGDEVWFSRGSLATAPVNVVGGGGSVVNTFAGLTAADLAALQMPSVGTDLALQMNILPYAALALSIDNSATLSLPASLDYSYDILGVAGGGNTIASGNLYSLSTGTQTDTVSGTWYSPSTYSIGLDATCHQLNAGADCSYMTANLPNPVSLNTGSGGFANIPIVLGPPSSSGGGASTDFPHLGPLFPGDNPCLPDAPCTSPCVPDASSPSGTDCVTNVTVTGGGTRVPEPGTWALWAIGLLGVAGAARRFTPRFPLLPGARASRQPGAACLPPA